MSLRKFSDVSVGDLLPEKAVTLTRGNLANYSGVAGDPNPIHFSDEVARLAGLPDVVAHGMLSMGMGAGYVTEWLGDPGAVTEYNVRFTSPVIVAADKAAERARKEFPAELLEGDAAALDPNEGADQRM